jgi:CcmD family protein
VNSELNDYLIAAFVIVWAILLLYVGVVALRTSRIAREVELLTRLVERQDEAGTGKD